MGINSDDHIMCHADEERVARFVRVCCAVDWCGKCATSSYKAVRAVPYTYTGLEIVDLNKPYEANAMSYKPILVMVTCYYIRFLLYPDAIAARCDCHLAGGLAMKLPISNLEDSKQDRNRNKENQEERDRQRPRIRNHIPFLLQSRYPISSHQ